MLYLDIGYFVILLVMLCLLCGKVLVLEDMLVFICEYVGV